MKDIEWVMAGILLGFLLYSLYRGERKRREKARAADPEKCDHLFWPAYDKTGKITGQQCALCPKFNSLSAMGIQDGDWNPPKSVQRGIDPSKPWPRR